MIIDITREQLREAVEAGIANSGDFLTDSFEQLRDKDFRAKLRKLADTAEYVGASFTSTDEESGICAHCPAREVGLHQHYVDEPVDNTVGWKFIDGYDACLDRVLGVKVVAYGGLTHNVLRVVEEDQT